MDLSIFEFIFEIAKILCKKKFYEARAFSFFIEINRVPLYLFYWE